MDIPTYYKGVGSTLAPETPDDIALMLRALDELLEDEAVEAAKAVLKSSGAVDCALLDLELEWKRGRS